MSASPAPLEGVTWPGDATVPPRDQPKIGLALGSGSARGWAHIGVLRGLEEAGVVPDVVCGTSAGAFVGAAYATQNLDALEDWARRLTAREIFSLMDLTLSAGGVLAGQRAMEFLRARGRDVRIEEMPVPFAAVATDLQGGREVWLQQGPLVEAVRASMALPGVLTPAHIDGRWLVDGGLVNPVPTSVCRALGADLVIAVDLNTERPSSQEEASDAGASDASDSGAQRPSSADAIGAAASELWESWATRVPALRQLSGGRRRGGRAPSVIDVVTASINIMQDRITSSRMVSDPPDLLLAPRLPQIRMFDFDAATEAIEAGRNCVAERAAALGDLLSVEPH